MKIKGNLQQKGTWFVNTTTSPEAPADDSVAVWAAKRGLPVLFVQPKKFLRPIPLLNFDLSGAYPYILSANGSTVHDNFSVLDQVTSSSSSQNVMADTMGVTAEYIRTNAGNLSLSASQSIWRRGRSGNNWWSVLYYTRFNLPTASYDQSGTGTGFRFRAGLAASDASGAWSTDDPSIQRMCIERIHNGDGTQDANFMIVTRDNTGSTRTSTGLAFTPQKTYEVWLWSPPDDNTVYWYIGNVTDGTSAEGTVTLTLPQTTTNLIPGIFCYNINAVDRRLRFEKMVCTQIG